MTLVNTTSDNKTGQAEQQPRTLTSTQQYVSPPTQTALHQPNAFKCIRCRDRILTCVSLAPRVNCHHCYIADVSCVKVVVLERECVVDAEAAVEAETVVENESAIDVEITIAADVPLHSVEEPAIGVRCGRCVAQHLVCSGEVPCAYCVSPKHADDCATVTKLW